MKTIKVKLTIIAILLCNVTINAYDFEVDNIYYTIISLTDFTVKVAGTSNDTITSLDIPNHVNYKGKSLSVVGIEQAAFKDNVVLQNVSMCNTIQFIEKESFSGCKSLSGITISECLNTLGSKAFYGCISLKEIELPIDVKEIPESLFYGCTKLQDIKLSPYVETIGAYAFSNSGISSISLPETLQYMGGGVFEKSELKFTIIPANIKEIPAHCFRQCHNLESVELPAELLTIGSYAFNECTEIDSINLPSALLSISEGAFQGCSSLKHFSIPDNVKEIHPSILWDCPEIRSLSFGSALDGLPVRSNYSWSSYNGFVDFLSLGGNYYKQDNYPYTTWDRTYLTGLREVVIKDSPESFSIKGFQVNGNTTTAAFANLDIDYYYVGRPLVDIKEWSDGRGTYGFTVKHSQGYGHIRTLEIAGYCTSVPYFYQKIDTLVLGEEIKTLNTLNIYTNDLAKVVCKSSIPPTITNWDYNKAFPTNVFTDALLLVPNGAKEAYMQADGWKNFWNIEELPPIIPVEEIVLDANEIFLYETESYELNATIYPENATNKTILWSISDSTVATIDNNGKVTAINSGTATITAKANDGSAINTSCQLTVKELTLEKCEMPMICYAEGKVSFDCATQDVEVISEVIAEYAHKYRESTYELIGTYTITAYATKPKFENSDTVSITLCWIECDEEHNQDTDTGVLSIQSSPVLIQSDGGVVTLTGLTNGTKVIVYDTAGCELDTKIAANKTVTLNTNLTVGKVAIIIIGRYAIKVVIR